MAGMKLNLADVEVKSFEPLPAGQYHVIITDWEPRPAGPEAKNPGKYYVNIEMTVQSGPFEDRKIWTNVNLNPTALFTLKGIAQAADLETQLDGLESEDEDFADLARAVGNILQGAEFIVGLTKRQGRDNPEPSYYKAPTSENLAKLPKGAKGSATPAASSSGGSLLP
jgi:hypothetical protein